VDHVVFEETVGVERQQKVGQLARESERNQLGDGQELRGRPKGVPEIDTDQTSPKLFIDHLINWKIENLI
jgi:hypothetical protein